MFAESNRLPFDLPESEGELVAGFHTEYGGFKMLLFFMGEYGHMMVASALIAIFYTGGYDLPYLLGFNSSAFVKEAIHAATDVANFQSIVFSLVGLAWMSLKIGFLLWVFIWVRWTLPRFRYDHLMDLGWKTMLPWAIFNVIITAAMLLVGQGF